MYDSLMESEERSERLRRRNQRDRDRRAAEIAQQREARLARRRVRDRTHRASRAVERLDCETPSNIITLTEQAPARNEKMSLGTKL